ncbi:uncharacterized protein LAESUDRAFT_815649 [Laetiporus sulphureus 93-53]|uniref:FAD-binding domain-containing protein n=1 Tax=Laetiporus sulphureus 93-53 TaxID=1314785 RepID=A0A165BYR5_9APHY|nr:uncharacterized protein LAESUDRAFT_815649 [Laetiporus sulphureus 93-53]KZT01893.1 hypothetical protein LAESUDRAFT_815649 [Laetiporus sulphureus 93-53]
MDIYESTAVLSGVGAGIGVSPRVWQILKELGLEDDLLSITHMKDGQVAPHSMVYRKADQPQGIFVGKIESPFVTYHRAHFQKVLNKHLPDPCKLHMSKRLTTYVTMDTSEIRLQFADGSSVTCNVLVGCDGIRSTVRDAKPVWTGKIMYRSLVPKDVLEAASPGNPLSQEVRISMGKDRCVITYPISQGQQINFGAHVYEPALEGTPYNNPWMHKCAKEEFIGAFSMFESHMQDLLNDGFVLAAILAHLRVTRETVPQALQVYDQIRRPFSQSVAAKSRAVGHIFDLRGEGMEKLTLEESIAGGVSKEQLEQME